MKKILIYSCVVIPILLIIIRQLQFEPLVGVDKHIAEIHSEKKVVKYEVLDSINKTDFCSCEFDLYLNQRLLKKLRMNPIENESLIKDVLVDSINHYNKFDQLKNEKIYLYRFEILERNVLKTNYYYIDENWSYLLWDGSYNKFVFDEIEGLDDFIVKTYHSDAISDKKYICE